MSLIKKKGDSGKTNCRIVQSDLDGYDSRSETLEVEFTNGAVYQYYNVPLTLYEAFMQRLRKASSTTVK